MIYNNINNSIRQNINALINQNQRNDTIANDIKNSSVFKQVKTIGMGLNSGKLVPIYVQDVMPHDIVHIDFEAIVRLAAISTNPLMSINYDVMFAFVSYDMIDEKFHNVMGETNSYGYSDSTLEFPKIIFDTDFEYDLNDLGSYLEVPTYINCKDDWFNAYYALAYGKFFNDWVRDQNLMSNIDITSIFSTREIKTSDYPQDENYLTQIKFMKGLAPVCKFPNYFTTNLPYQQKGNPINIGAIDLNNLQVTGTIDNDNTAPTFYPRSVTNLDNSGWRQVLKNTASGTGVLALGSKSNVTGGTDLGFKLGLKNGKVTSSNGQTSIYNINDLRYAIVTQHYLERLALGGSRYVEQLKSIWGVSIDPKIINRSELIGGYSGTFQFNNVPQTSQSTTSSPLGTISTQLYNKIGCPKISYATSLHGIIMGFLVIRTPINQGGQGLPRRFKFRDRFSLANPLFNGIGEQPTYNYEIKYQGHGHATEDYSVFGYNEPFLNWKSQIDNSVGIMSLNHPQSLFKYFLFGQKYETTPKLDENFITYDSNIIGNMLYEVNGESSQFYQQFIAYCTFNITYISQLSLYENPKVIGI